MEKTVLSTNIYLVFRYLLFYLFTAKKPLQGILDDREKITTPSYPVAANISYFNYLIQVKILLPRSSKQFN